MADRDTDIVSSAGADVADQDTRALVERVRSVAARHRGIMEIALLAALYALYSATRSLADGSLTKAVESANTILRLEQQLGLDVEHGINHWAMGNLIGSVAASYWYASAHFIVTGGVMLWLFHRRRALYPYMRNILLAATACALGLFFLLPTAPPRLMGGIWQDMLASTSDYGWWGEHAMAPRGMGSMTNELAAFPSMHAGWSLWVAIAIVAATRNRLARTLAIAYPIITAIDVLVTGNHWIIDVFAGWAIVAVIATLVLRSTGGRRARTLTIAPQTD